MRRLRNHLLASDLEKDQIVLCDSSERSQVGMGSLHKLPAGMIHNEEIINRIKATFTC